MCGRLALLTQCASNRDVIGVSLVLVELEAPFDGLDRHLDSDDRFHQRREPLWRQAIRRPRPVRRQPGFELRRETIEMIGDVSGRDEMHRPG